MASIILCISILYSIKTSSRNSLCCLFPFITSYASSIIKSPMNEQYYIYIYKLMYNSCSVRLAADRRIRIMPIRWAKLPGLSQYQKRLKELSNAIGHMSGVERSKALEGLRDLTMGDSAEEFTSLSSYNGNGSSANYSKTLNPKGTVHGQLSTITDSMDIWSGDESDVFTAAGAWGEGTSGMNRGQLEQSEAMEAQRAKERSETLEGRLQAVAVAEKKRGV